MNCIWSIPWPGARMLRDLLAGECIRVGRLHVSTLMKRMGIEAIYRKPNTSKPAPGHKVYPYLLRRLPVTRPNQVWAMDITYAPWPAASSIWPRSSIGSVAGRCPGGSRSAWMPYRSGRGGVGPWQPRNLQHRQSEDGRQFPGGLPQTLIDRGRLVPRGASVRPDPHSDRPTCLSLDLSTAREHLAVRLCLDHCL